MVASADPHHSWSGGAPQAASVRHFPGQGLLDSDVARQGFDVLAARPPDHPLPLVDPLVDAHHMSSDACPASDVQRPMGGNWTRDKKSSEQGAPVQKLASEACDPAPTPTDDAVQALLSIGGGGFAIVGPAPMIPSSISSTSFAATAFPSFVGPVSACVARPIAIDSTTADNTARRSRGRPRGTSAKWKPQWEPPPPGGKTASLGALRRYTSTATKEPGPGPLQALPAKELTPFALAPASAEGPQAHLQVSSAAQSCTTTTSGPPIAPEEITEVLGTAVDALSKAAAVSAPATKARKFSWKPLNIKCM